MLGLHQFGYEMAFNQAITTNDVQKHFGIQDAIPSSLLDEFRKVDTRYRFASFEEQEEYLLMVFKRMSRVAKVRTRDENLAAFETGWRENLELLRREGLSERALRPVYFRPAKFLRYQKKIIVSPNPQIEYDLFSLARTLIFYSYLREVDHIYELGCGCCGNLFRLSQIFPQKYLHGFDWTQASVDIADALKNVHHLRCEGNRLDMLAPPEDLELKPNSAVITIHAIEQLGTGYGALLQSLLRSKPRVVVQFEPILELYDEENMYDQLALVYSKSRGYLTGYLSALQALEREGRIELLKAHRPHVGGVIHESSLIVWRPK